MISRTLNPRTGVTTYLVTADSMEAVQAIIFDVMLDENCTFTLPVRLADGQYGAIGHIQRRD